MRIKWRFILIMLILLSVVVIAGGGCGAAAAELALTLKTTQDADKRHEAAVDLAKMFSVSATQQVVSAAKETASAAAGAAALRDEYVRILKSESGQTSDELADCLLAIDCLAVVADKQSAQTLGNVALGSNGYNRNANVKLRAVKALASFRTEASTTELVKLISTDPSLIGLEETRNIAAQALSVRPEAAHLLVAARPDSSDSGYIGWAIDGTLLKMGEPAATAVLAVVGQASWPSKLLPKFGSSVAPRLAEKLASTNSSVRDQALSALLTLYTTAPAAAGPYLILAKRVPLLIEGRLNRVTDSASTTAVLNKIGQPAAAALVSKAVSLLTDDATWTNYMDATTIYHLLGGLDSQTVVNELVRQVTLDARNRIRVLILAVKLGIPGSEDRLNDLLAKHGNRKMAEDFLNCGSEKLAAGAKRWAQNHGYVVETATSGQYIPQVTWGSFF